MIHRVVTVGPFQCNCHILADERTREGVIVDPGDDAGELLAQVKDLGITVKALVHTHCHLDHIGGTRPVKEETGARIMIHEADRALYEGLKEQFAATLRLFGVKLDAKRDPLPVDEYLQDRQKIAFGRHALEVIFTPGHTPGSCCFALSDEKRPHVFSGDTLFAGSIGRTDLWGGDMDLELESIRTRLFTLERDTLVHPGHGPDTSVRDEKESNPFLQ